MIMETEKNPKMIAIHSVPRSGSSWLGEIFNSSPTTNFKFQPLFSYAFKGRLTPDSSKNDIDNFFKDISTSDDSFLNQEENRQQKNYPRFKKNSEIKQIVYKEVRYHNILENMLSANNNTMLIGLIRNPLSVISSWLLAPKEFKEELGWIRLEEWRYAHKKNMGKPEEFNGYEKWKEAALLFHSLAEKHPKQVHLVNYSNLLMDTEIEIESIFNFCGISVEQQTRDFIESSRTKKNSDPYSVFRSNQTDDHWKLELNPEIAKHIIKDLKGTRLEAYLQ